MDNGPRLATDWTWWMTLFVVLVWLVVVAGTVWLFVRSRRARRRQRGADARPPRRPQLPPGSDS